MTKKGTWKLAGLEFIGKYFCCPVHSSIQLSNLFFVWQIPLVLPNLFEQITERVNETDAVEPVVCQSWSSRASKMTQPNLDYMGKRKNICARTARFPFFRVTRLSTTLRHRPRKKQPAKWMGVVLRPFTVYRLNWLTRYWNPRKLVLVYYFRKNWHEFYYLKKKAFAQNAGKFVWKYVVVDG